MLASANTCVKLAQAKPREYPVVREPHAQRAWS